MQVNVILLVVFTALEIRFKKFNRNVATQQLNSFQSYIHALTHIYVGRIIATETMCVAKVALQAVRKYSVCIAV